MNNSVFDNYSCDGQITISDYLAAKIRNKEVKDLTNWINSQGKCQFDQIGDVHAFDEEQEEEDERDQD